MLLETNRRSVEVEGGPPSRAGPAAEAVRRSRRRRNAPGPVLQRLPFPPLGASAAGRALRTASATGAGVRRGTPAAERAGIDAADNDSRAVAVKPGVPVAGGAARVARRPGLSDALVSIWSAPGANRVRAALLPPWPPQSFPSARNTHRGIAGVGTCPRCQTCGTLATPTHARRIHRTVGVGHPDECWNQFQPNQLFKRGKAASSSCRQ